MDFDLTEEQSMLKDSLDRLLSDKYGFEDREKIRKGEPGWSKDVWSQLAELGLLMLPFAEEDGGFGGGPEDVMIAMESLGGVLSLEPFLATVVLAGGMLREAGTGEQRGELVPRIVGGELIMALAHCERGARYTLSHVETTAKKDGDSYVLNGEKSLVLHGADAGKFIVSARTSGETGDEDGISLFLVDADADGISRRGYRLQDDRPAAEITLSDVKVPASALLGEEGQGYGALAKVHDQAIAALAGEAVGLLTRILATTTQYLKDRKQFGVPIAKFQVLQHDSVDIFIALEQMRSIAMYATAEAGSDEVAERARAAAAAKVMMGQEGRKAAETAIQLHGGVGVTMEYAISHYFKRVTVNDMLFGNADHHISRLAEMGSLLDP
ncbi:acyl-CoA dehydrogenase family protein [Notoacmeibacter sp. MSK16QG-6]|uniref:acyl-CoA dehydrogenase family protein n=1 Tax=Notoacmeibacter sp. MSK16QG-6 TaxID=2957982 RepID=UPI00209D30CB|nr:acyl-CoA dehydrogenase family protein [Notoacmeibacter sp. MSK16QG-6]MCP1198486.1 acyl-CoA dehydrogenase family protein [Notoacmeibacter sp. MSK16QG-6]